MGKEIERKFLIQGKIPLELGEPTLIKQGYIFAEKGKHLRIRIVKNAAILGLKYTEGLVRDEFEYNIPFEEGMEMYKKCEMKVEKIRFSVKHEGFFYDLDFFPNNIRYMEVEFPTKEDSTAFIKPEWLGKEITGESEYSNITLSKQKLSFN